MKRSVLFIALILFSNFINAQDADYSGPAKLHVKSFWDGVKKLQEGKGYSADNLEKQLKYTKEKDPAYNTAAMEAEFKIWKEKAVGTKTQRQLAEEKVEATKQKTIEEGMSKMKNENLLQTVIDGTGMQVGNNNLPYMDKAMADYKVNVEAVLQLDLSKYKTKLDDLKRYVDRSHTLAADNAIKLMKTLLKESKSAETFDPAYKELQFRQLYWDAVRKIYNGDAVCEKYYASITELLAQIGSPENISKNLEKNRVEKIKNTKMKAAVVKDAALEKALMTGFNSKYGSKYNGTALKAVMLQDGWTIERNTISGIVTGRHRICELAYKGTDGKCYLLPNEIFIYQAYVGSSFTNTEVVYDGFKGEEMLCENVK